VAAVPRTGESPLNWRSVVRLGLLAAFGGALAWSLASQWGAVGPLLGRLSIWSLAAAQAAVLAGILATFLCWREVMAGLGGRLPVAAGAWVFFLGQLGKYLPGSVWPVMAQMELGRDHQVPERVSGAAVGVFLLVVVGSGLVVAAAAVPLLGPDAAGAYWWLLAVLPLVLAVVHPPMLNRLLALALRLARRPPLPSPLPAVAVARSAGWALASWLAYGAHVWVLAGQLGGGVGPLLLAQATAAFAAAWCAGFLLVVAPAGAGVREAALVVLLGGVITRPAAVVVAVVSRLLFVVGDLGWGVVALVVGRGRVRPDRAGPPTRRSRGTGW
jgi:glycosyltransferase 2 family protein